jgi:hypothetical protein
MCLLVDTGFGIKCIEICNTQGNLPLSDFQNKKMPVIFKPQA